MSTKLRDFAQVIHESGYIRSSAYELPAPTPSRDELVSWLRKRWRESADEDPRPRLYLSIGGKMRRIRFGKSAAVPVVPDDGLRRGILCFRETNGSWTTIRLTIEGLSITRGPSWKGRPQLYSITLEGSGSETASTERPAALGGNCG